MTRIARQILFWIQLGLGVTAGAVILVMSVTGVLLAFERQIVHFVDRDLRTVGVPTEVHRRKLGDMLATASASLRGTPAIVTVRPGAADSVAFTFGKDRKIYVDPYAGAVLGEGSMQVRAFFARVERWHRTLGEPLGKRGPLRSIAAAANVLFLAILLSGVLLWLARGWSRTAGRKTLAHRAHLTRRGPGWNRHATVALFCTGPLVLITLTGVVMSYPRAQELMCRLAGNGRSEERRDAGPSDQGRTPGRRASADRAMVNLDRAVAASGARFDGWRSMSLQVPAPHTTAVAVIVDTGTGGEVEKRHELIVDSSNGQVVRSSGFRDLSRDERLRTIVRVIHTGEEGGLAGQAIAALASAGGGFLAWTGLSFALRRLRMFVHGGS